MRQAGWATGKVRVAGRLGEGGGISLGGGCFVGGGAIAAGSDDAALRRLEAIAQLPTERGTELFNVLDAYLRDFHTAKAYAA